MRGVPRVVVREGEAIRVALAQMGAERAASDWDQMRQRREVRAGVNRLVNYDDANLRRSAQAAVAACARVERALEILGPEVPEHLREAGELRAQLEVSRDGTPLGRLDPGKNRYFAEQQTSNEVAIRSDWLRAEDLFVIADRFNDDGTVWLKVLVNPLVNLIWVAGFVFLCLEDCRQAA